MTARGIRNNNPGNLRRSTDPWQGLAPIQDDPDFFQFSSPSHGIRALARTLITYQDRHGLHTVDEMIGRFAPEGADNNPTGAYAAFVAGRMGVDRKEAIDVHDWRTLRPMVEAIISFENGAQPYTGAQIDKGLVLAGIEPPAQPLSKSRTVKGSQVAGAAGAAATAAGVAGQIAPALPVLEWMRDNLSLALIVMGVAVLAGIGYAVWARIDDRRKGLR